MVMFNGKALSRENTQYANYKDKTAIQINLLKLLRL